MRQRLLSCTCLLAAAAAAGAVAGCDEVIVEAVPVASVSLDPGSLDLVLGQEASVQVVLRDEANRPLSTDGRSVSYQSTNPAVVQVSNTGQVSAVGLGVAEVRATVEGKTGSAGVSVTLADVRIDPDMEPLALQALEMSVALAAVGLDLHGDAVPDVQFSWSSDDEAVATVSDAGLLTAVGEGTTVVRAHGGGASGSRSVQVEQLVASVHLDPDALTLNALGRTFGLTATAQDGNGFDVTVTEFQWSSGDEAVATVDAQGVVTAVAPGSTTIHVNVGSHGAGADVVVRQVVADITVDPAARTLPMWESLALEVTVVDSAGAAVQDPDITWSSANTDVLVVDDEGVLTTQMVGSTTVTATIPILPGSETTRAAEATVRVSPRPERALAGLLNATCALDDAGAAYCWGGNFGGVFGGAFQVTTPVSLDGGRVFQRIAGGNHHACGIATDYTLFCWGFNGHGRLGDGSFESRHAPQQVQLAAAVVDVAAGNEHTCALDDAGTAYCWGAGDDGRLGTGLSDGEHATPLAIAGFTFRALAAGGRHSCAIDDDGNAHCWGANDQGQLGNGTFAGSHPSPTAVAGGLTFTRLSAGQDHTCGLGTDGRVYCWGNHNFVQLGAGATGSSASPVLASERFFDDVQTFANTTCGLAGDTAFCWGRGDWGQVGHGHWNHVDEPVAVPLAGAVAVAVGGNHACALTRNDGLHCWGSNAASQLGNGEHGLELVPVRASAFPATVTEISKSWNRHTCAGTAGSAFSCVGGNTRGQIGDGSHLPRLTAHQVTGAGMKDVGTGVEYTCLLNTAGMAECWGANDFGQLGAGTTSHERLTREEALGGPFVALSVGTWSACALTDDGDAYCWGRNARGQVGDGTTEHRSTPTLVAGGHVFRQISFGSAHVCAVTTDDEGYCWGLNQSGALGDGNSGEDLASAVPIPVSGGLLFSMIAAGNTTSCGVTTDQEVYCWGNDNFGLVTGSAGGITASPVQVPGVPAATAVSVGVGHACALTTQGEAWCWGRNLSGEFGIGTQDDVLSPRRAAGSLLFASLAVGSNATCGVDLDGAPWCWGFQDHGRLGNGRSAFRPDPVRALTSFPLPPAP